MALAVGLGTGGVTLSFFANRVGDATATGLALLVFILSAAAMGAFTIKKKNLETSAKNISEEDKET